MTETIVWIQTPKCRDCSPSAIMKRRLPCLGCTREPEKPGLPAGPKNGKLRKTRQKLRDAEIGRLREKKLSITAISRQLDLPRSTVFNAVRRNRERTAAGTIRQTNEYRPQISFSGRN